MAMKNFSDWARLKEGMYDYMSDSKYHNHYEKLQNFLQSLAGDFWADRDGDETEEAYLARMIQFVRRIQNAAGPKGKSQIRNFVGELTQKQNQAKQKTQQQAQQQEQPPQPPQQAQQQQQPPRQPRPQQQDDLQGYQASRKEKQAYDNLPWYKRMFTQAPR